MALDRMTGSRIGAAAGLLLAFFAVRSVPFSRVAVAFVATADVDRGGAASQTGSKKAAATKKPAAESLHQEAAGSA